MASTEKNNIKTVILSAIRTPLTALANNFDALKNSIFLRADAQDRSITQMQTHIAQNHETITNTFRKILTYNEEITELKNAQYTRDQLVKVLNRNRELEWICSQLYNIVYEIKLTGSTNKDMPNFEHPIITRAELEAKYREQIGVLPETELTEEQLELFENYIVQWFLDNPGYVFDETLPKI